MRSNQYFQNSAWTLVMHGSTMQSESMSWEMLAGMGSNGLAPLIRFEDPNLVARYISYLDARWVRLLYVTKPIRSIEFGMLIEPGSCTSWWDSLMTQGALLMPATLGQRIFRQILPVVS